MVEQQDRECDFMRLSRHVQRKRQHTRKVLYLEKCYRAVCAGEMLSQQILLDLLKLSWQWAHAHLCLPRSALEHAGWAVALNKYEQKQKRSNNVIVKMHIQLCKNIVLGNYYCALLQAGAYSQLKMPVAEELLRSNYLWRQMTNLCRGLNL